MWLQDGDRAIALKLSEPTDRAAAAALILPPVGYAYSSSFAQLRALAEHLAAVGVRTARMDYPGTGDSGDDDDATVGVWLASAAGAVDALRRAGAVQMFLIGCQFGATLAAQLAVDDGGITGVVAIAPEWDGRRFVRTMRMMGLSCPDGGVSVGGYALSARLLTDIAAQGRPDCAVPLHEVQAGAETDAFLARPAEEAVINPTVNADVVTWISARADRDRSAPAWRSIQNDRTCWMRAGHRVCERFTTLGVRGLAAVVTTADDADIAGSPVLLLVNSGSDPRSGPGRAWTELARTAAPSGIVVVRVDMTGWGESAVGDNEPGRPYDAHCADDIVACARALRDDGAAQVTVGGLCAGAWMALAAARRAPDVIDGVFALNPQLYWQPGDPVEALMSTTHARRTQEIAEIKADADRGVWDALDAAGDRPPAARLLEDLTAHGTGTALVFAEGDDGLEYLRDRCGRRLSVIEADGVVRVRELPGVDHALQRVWLRPTAFAAIVTELTALRRRAAIPASTERSPHAWSH